MVARLAVDIIFEFTHLSVKKGSLSLMDQRFPVKMICDQQNAQNLLLLFVLKSLDL